MGTTPLPPDLQRSLELLFEMFSSYVAARTEREQAALHASIVDLFARLGVASDYPVVRQAAEMFERIQHEPAQRREREATLANRARDIVALQIRLFERTKGRPTLSAGARQMLRVPIVESAEFTEKLNERQVIASLDKVLDSVAEEPISVAEGREYVRTSVAVIRALAKNFCNIPPFCSEKMK
jgi:hypothetical protein